MGDHADDSVQQALDADEAGMDDFDHGARFANGVRSALAERACRACGTQGLHWGYNPGTQGYRLYDRQGHLHSCKEYLKGSRPRPSPSPRPPPPTERGVRCHAVLGALDSGDLGNVWVDSVHIDFDEATARKVERGWVERQCAFIVRSCTLIGTDDLITLGQKLDDANAEIAKLKELLKVATASAFDVLTHRGTLTRRLAEPPLVTGYMVHNGHCFPLRGEQTEPDEVAHCTRCGVSYAGTGPTMSDPCQGDMGSKR